MTTDLLGSGSTVQTGSLNAATASTASSKTSASTSQTQLSSDINFFLKLFTEQLKNQDPTQPLDTAQFTQQIAQYSNVQQQVNTNVNLEKLLKAYNQSGFTQAVGYIGKEIESVGDKGVVAGGQGAFSYFLPLAAQDVRVTLKNSGGSVVFTGRGDVKAGRNIVVWDGVNSATGRQEPDGVYTIAIEAKDQSGKAMKTETRSVAIVNGVETDEKGNTILSAGEARFNFADVLAVRDPSRAVLDNTSQAPPG